MLHTPDISCVSDTHKFSQCTKTRNQCISSDLFYGFSDNILVPRHGSDKREYLTLGFFEHEEIAHDSCLFISRGTLPDFSVLSSKMHMSWLKHVGGKIKSDYRYAVRTVYNTFPMPAVKDLSKHWNPTRRPYSTPRAKYPDATLADLYDPDVMPADLCKAHRANDLERFYRKGKFTSERERVEHLFMLYEKTVDGMLAETNKPRKRKTKPQPDTGHIR